MVEMHGKYVGGLRCSLTHGPSGATLETDAPKDNMGKGEAFSPTDLMGAALGSCILTTIAIVTERDGKSILNSYFKVVKEMNPNPRRIARLGVEIFLPSEFAEDYRKKIEHIAHTCPVHRSIHPDTKMDIIFNWSL